MAHVFDLFEANEDLIYQYWDNLDAQERLNWLEPYNLDNLQKTIMLPLGEVFGKLSYPDMISLNHDMLDEVIGEV